MNRKELITKGVQMFKASCYNVKCTLDRNGTRWWTGRTCESGGAYIEHRMNEDTMTPVSVAFEVGHVGTINAIKDIRRKAEEDANRAAIEQLKRNLAAERDILDAIEAESLSVIQHDRDTCWVVDGSGRHWVADNPRAAMRLYFKSQDDDNYNQTTF